MHAPLDALAALVAALPRPPELGEAAVTTAEELPPEARRLLAHHEHMTERLREHYAGPIRLEVIQDSLAERHYAREILLRLESGAVVEYGVVRIRRGMLAENVLAEVLRRESPLGDILIRNDVLRRIEPMHYIRFAAGGSVAARFGRPGKPAHGRLAIIFCDSQPAIELLEVV